MANITALPRIYASDHFTYAINALELHRFLFPLNHDDDQFRHWIDNRIHHYGFEQGYDFVSIEDGSSTPLDLSISLDMAKELARIERTAQGRQARYYLIEFAREQTKHDFSDRANRNDIKRSEINENELNESELNESELGQKIQQLNQLAHDLKVENHVMAVASIDMINLIKAIRQYQTIADLYLTPDHDINPYWVNQVIEDIKQQSGKPLLDEEDIR
ncbi:hypothetical protein CBF23_000020 [Marinomonas agarivorans]|nr:hypothetical protein CBF23_000020 [Marinomonas agarivorans]